MVPAVPIGPFGDDLFVEAFSSPFVVIGRSLLRVLSEGEQRARAAW